MMLVECVPNISEGRSSSVINRVAAAVCSVPEVSLLNVDPGFDANRTVLTFAGEINAVRRAALEMIKTAAAMIDMTEQQGEHPRLGAVDVVPFVPLAGATMGACVDAARELGREVASELGVPVYLYESAARSVSRSNLADIRRGEYEGLKQKLQHPDWEPDFGGRTWNAKFGAVVIGARKFLIAYNINLSTTDPEIAKDIAAAIRTRSTSETRLAACKAIGWYMPAFGCAQVSTNLYDFELTGLLDAYRACADEAAKRGCAVTGSELVGLVPMQALLDAGREVTTGDQTERLAAAANVLGLSQFKPFKAAEHVIELVLAARGLI